MALDQVYAIVVNYNGYADTIECLQSLKEQTQVDCRPLVVDNASTNNSVARIKAAHPDVEVVVTKKNLGFAGGNNVGIKHALAQGCDYLFLVNNDTTMEPDCLQQLLWCAYQDPNAGIITPSIYYYSDKNRPWFTGSSFDPATFSTQHSHEDLKAQKHTAPFHIPWTTGCAMFIPSSRMLKAKGFDARYFCYWEDVDLSFKIKQQGAYCVLCPTSVLYHKISTTANTQGKKPYYYYSRNYLLFASKYGQMNNKRRWLFECAKRYLQNVKHIYRYSTDKDEKVGAAAQALGIMDFYLKRFGRCHYEWL